MQFGSLTGTTICSIPCARRQAAPKRSSRHCCIAVLPARMMADPSRGGPKNNELDVAVVGGGPGGLATAAALRAAFGDEMRVKVFESQKGFRIQGSVIGLAINCQHALDAISPTLLSKFTCCGEVINQMVHMETNGTIRDYGKTEVADTLELQKKYHKLPVAIGWHECRQLLFQELPPGTVEFNKQVSHYAEDENGVTLHFKQDEPPVRAQVLVGADGYFSKVRAQCLDDGPPTFNKAVLWRARVGWQEGLPPDNTGMRYTLPGMHKWPPAAESRGALILPMGTIESTRDRNWTWILQSPVADVIDAGVDFDPEVRTVRASQGDAASGGALENALKVFSDFPAEVLDLLKNTDPATVTQHGLYTRDLSQLKYAAANHKLKAGQTPQVNGTHAKFPNSTGHNKENIGGVEASKATQDPRHSSESKHKAHGATSHVADVQHSSGQAANGGSGSKGIWGKGRVTLLGDAAHATINNGQGFCLAIEDGVVLAWHLKRLGLSPEALRNYETERLPRVKTVYVKGRTAASMADKEQYLYIPTFKPLWKSQENFGSADTCITDFEPMAED